MSHSRATRLRASMRIAMNVCRREYFHVKTTPFMKIHDAISMACAYPLLVAPKSKGADMYIDAGYIANYQVNVFDGWFLSLNRKTPFSVNRVGRRRCHRRFAEEDSRTIGFSFHPDVSYDVDRPNTELAIKFGKLEQIHEEEQNKQDEIA